MIVIKFGGHAMTDGEGLFAKAVQGALDIGEECIIVHGGGPQIDRALKAANVEPEFKGGFRVTTPEVFAIVQRVLGGEVLRDVVAQLRSAGLNALGITGRDGGLLIAKKLTQLVNGSKVDLGQVGEVVRVDTSILETLLDSGFLPVVSSIATQGGETFEDSSAGLNVNADLAAAAIAGAMKASSLIFMTDVPGIYKNWPDTSSLISNIRASELAAMKDEFSEGMAPKVSACLIAVQSGAQSVRVIDGTDPQSFALALRGIGGTLVTP
jgi:acetylglutamate kinase